MTLRSLIYGLHAVTARLRQNAASVKEIYVDETRTDARMRGLIALIEEHRLHLIKTQSGRLDRMTGHARHQGVVASIDPAKGFIALDDVLDATAATSLLLVLDGVQDPHNLGACLRVADAFGVDAVIAPRDRAAGLNATVAKVASGAAESVPFVTVTNLARALRAIRECGVWIVGAADDAANDLRSVKLTGAVAWVFGAESEGLRRLTREHCDELVRIPMLGTVASLNVAVAAGVCLFETLRQRGA